MSPAGVLFLALITAPPPSCYPGRRRHAGSRPASAPGRLSWPGRLPDSGCHLSRCEAAIIEPQLWAPAPTPHQSFPVCSASQRSDKCSHRPPLTDGLAASRLAAAAYSRRGESQEEGAGQEGPRAGTLRGRREDSGGKIPEGKGRLFLFVFTPFLIGRDGCWVGKSDDRAKAEVVDEGRSEKLAGAAALLRRLLSSLALICERLPVHPSLSATLIFLHLLHHLSLLLFSPSFPPSPSASPP